MCIIQKYLQSNSVICVICDIPTTSSVTVIIMIIAVNHIPTAKV